MFQFSMRMRCAILRNSRMCHHLPSTQPSKGWLNALLLSVFLAVGLNSWAEPVATNMAVMLMEDTSTNLTLLGGGSGGALTYGILTTPTNGVLGVLNTNTGAVMYTPGTNFFGVDTFQFTVREGSVQATGTVSLTITGVNDAPVFVGTPANVSIPEGSLLIVTNDATDVDLPANVLIYSLVNPPSGAVISAAGVIAWTPTEAQGPSTNTIMTVVSDGLVSVTNEFVVTVTEFNVSPVAVNDSYPVSNASLTVVTPGILGNDTDGDLPVNTLTAVLVSGPTNGVLNLGSNGGFTYTPNLGFSGVDAFTYRANDGAVNSTVATVTLTVIDQGLRITSVNVTGGVATVTWTSQAGKSYRLLYKNDLTAASWSVVTGDATATSIATSKTNFVGTVPQRFYRIQLMSNNAPVLPAQSDRTVAEKTLMTVTNTASDANFPDEALSYSLIAAPAGVTILSNGVITWTPTEEQGPGTNTITTVVTDNGGLSATNSFIVTVTEVNVAPVFAGTPMNRMISKLTLLTVTNNATDGDLPVQTLSYQINSAPSGLTIDVNGVITWTPGESFGGTTNRIETVVSDGAVSVTNAFYIVVNEVPVATDDHYDLGEGVVLSIPASGILSNDSDGDGDGLTAILVSGALQGMVNLNADGGFVYTLANHFSGVDTFTYRVSDGKTNSNLATVSITVSNRIRITSMALSNEVVTLSWTSIAGRNYRLQYKEGLSETNWTDLWPEVSATGSTTLGTNAATAVDQRLYRVRCSTVTAVSPARADVVKAINAAANGDTVVVPSGSASWSSGISLGAKAITIQGAGIGATVVAFTGSGDLFSVSQHATVGTRITGFTFNGASGLHRRIIRTSGSPSTAAFRIDHCRFYSTNDAIFITTTGGGPGLIDHCVFLSEVAPIEMIHNEGYDFTSNAGWVYAVKPGSADAVYVEANSFTFNASGNPAYFYGASAMQNYYGSRTVFRYNTNTMCQFDNHGTAGQRGGRWYECYSNRFVTIANANQDAYFALRAGSGVVFGNIHTGPNIGAGNIKLEEEDCGDYPQQDQIGRGQNQTLDPLYIWDNTDMPIGNQSDSLIQEDRDYFTTAKPGYTPYVYPHPLQNGVMPPLPLPSTNRPPTASALSVDVTVNTSKAIKLSGTDLDGDALTYFIVSLPTNGVLSGTSPNLTYVPNNNYQGGDSFSFKANDGSLDSSPAPVSITIGSAPVVATNSYYVDQDHPNAVDSATAGTESQPWRTIGYALSQISGGDTILIKGSSTPYLIGDGWDICGPSGTAQSPTTLKAYPGHKPQLRGDGDNGHIALNSVAYWLIEGLDISNLTRLLVIRNGSSFVTVRGNTLHDSGWELVAVYGAAHDILFENNTLLRGGSIGNENGEGFDIGSRGGGDFVYNVTIRSNYIKDMKDGGIDLKHDTYNCLVEYNILTNCVANCDFGTWSILAFPTVSYPSSPNHIIRGNIVQSVASSTTGAGIGLQTGCYAYNNIVYNVTSPAYAIEIEGGDSYTRYCWNNTLDVPAARAIIELGGTGSIGNNIGPATSGNVAFNSAYFVDASTHDYRLVSGSAPIDSGSTPPFPVATDFNGVPRIAPPDQGAFEYVTTDSVLPPSR